MPDPVMVRPPSKIPAVRVLTPMTPPKPSVSMPHAGKPATPKPVLKPVTRSVSQPVGTVTKPIAKANTSQRMATPAAQKKAAGVKSAKAFTPAVRKKAATPPKRAL
jgi:hypothetical protein